MGTTPGKGHGADGSGRHARRQTLQHSGAIALAVVCVLLGLSAPAGAATGAVAVPDGADVIAGQVQRIVAVAGAAAATGEAVASARIPAPAAVPAAPLVPAAAVVRAAASPAQPDPASVVAATAVPVAAVTAPVEAAVTPDRVPGAPPHGDSVPVTVMPDSAAPHRHAGRPRHATGSGAFVRGKVRAGERGRRGPGYTPAAAAPPLGGSAAVTAGGWPPAPALDRQRSLGVGAPVGRARSHESRRPSGGPLRHRHPAGDPPSPAPSPAPAPPVGAPATGAAASASGAGTGVGGGAAALLAVLIIIVAGRSWARISLIDPVWCGRELVPRLERPG